MKWWWLSFADDARGGFLGGCVVQANSGPEAGRMAREKGLNPGGEVLAVLCNRTPEEAGVEPNRFLTPDEIPGKVSFQREER